MKKIFKLDLFVFGIILLLPTYLLRFSIFNIPTNFLEVLISLAFVWIIFKKNSLAKLKVTFDKKTWLLIIIILLGLFISTIFNKNYLIGLGIIKGWFLMPILLAIIVKTELSKEKIFLAIYSSALITAIIGLGYYLQGIITFDGRLQGFFNSPNYLAMFLAPAFIIGVIKIFSLPLKTNLPSTWLHTLSLETILFALYQTHSYATWTSLAVILLSLGMLYGTKKYKIKILLSIIIFSLLLVSFQWQNKKFQDLIHFSNRSSLSSRIMIWSSTEKILSDKWFLGIGPGNFQKQYLENQKNMPEQYLEWAVPHPHNLFLSFWLQAGLVGLLGFIFLVARWLKKAYSQPKNVWQFIAISIMFYFLIHGLVDTTYFKNDLAIIFWLNFITIL